MQFFNNPVFYITVYMGKGECLQNIKSERKFSTSNLTRDGEDSYANRITSADETFHENSFASHSHVKIANFIIFYSKQ